MSIIALLDERGFTSLENYEYQQRAKAVWPNYMYARELSLLNEFKDDDTDPDISQLISDFRDVHVRQDRAKQNSVNTYLASCNRYKSVFFKATSPLSDFFEDIDMIDVDHEPPPNVDTHRVNLTALTAQKGRKTQKQIETPPKKKQVIKSPNKVVTRKGSSMIHPKNKRILKREKVPKIPKRPKSPKRRHHGQPNKKTQQDGNMNGESKGKNLYHFNLILGITIQNRP